jgi:serine protease Do
MKEKENEKKEDKTEDKKAPAEGSAKDAPKEVQKEASDYDFIREQIRERPINRKKLLRRFALTAGMALIFGLVACLSFLILEPKFSKWLSGDENMELKVVELPENTEEEEVYQPQIIQEDEDPEQLVIETPIDQMSLTDEDMVSANQAEEIVSQNEAQETSQESQREDQPPQIIYEQVPLELEDYRQLYRKLYALSKEVSKSLVTVTAEPEDTEWMITPDASEYQTIGLIVGDNGYELLILADTEKLLGAEDINVRFADGSRGKLTQKAIDTDTGLGIYGIRLSALEGSTKDSITYAILGSSFTTSILGNAVMAVGNPLGVSSICYGAVTSASRLVTMRDASYQLLTTDIYGSKNASGVLVNIRGQVAGIICQRHNDAGMENMIYAYGISGIRKLIENLSNGKERAWLGLEIGEILPETALDMNIPQGVYIQQVEMDSPALAAGLAKGDIIQRIGNLQIVSVNDYMGVLQNMEPGEEVTIEYCRNNGEEYRDMKVNITLGKREE